MASLVSVWHTQPDAGQHNERAGIPDTSLLHFSEHPLSSAQTRLSLELSVDRRGCSHHSDSFQGNRSLCSAPIQQNRPSALPPEPGSSSAAATLPFRAGFTQRGDPGDFSVVPRASAELGRRAPPCRSCRRKSTRARSPLQAGYQKSVLSKNPPEVVPESGGRRQCQRPRAL